LNDTALSACGATVQHYWPLVGTVFGAGAVAVAVDEAVVLNGYPGGPFT
jgi:hypothetical protein